MVALRTMILVLRCRLVGRFMQSVSQVIPVCCNQKNLTQELALVVVDVQFTIIFLFSSFTSGVIFMLKFLGGTEILEYRM